MKKILFCLLFLFFLEILFSDHVLPAKESNTWQSVIRRIEERIDKGSLGQDLRITFKNFPHEVYTEEELMSYTIRADGKVIIQRDNDVRVVRISPSEFAWIFEFLCKSDLRGLPLNKPASEDGAFFSIILQEGKFKKAARFYKADNNKDIEVIWQYLFRLGEIFFENAGLRDKNEPVLAVCKGIIKEDEIDSDSDGIIDWLRLWVGFYSFKAEDLVIDFLGNRQNVFFSQGNSVKEFYINPYLFALKAHELKGFFDLEIDSVNGNPEGPYKMDMGFDCLRYRKDNYRKTPNLVLKDGGRWKFGLNLNQSVIIETKKGRPVDYSQLWWFNAAGISPRELRLEGRQGLDLSLNGQEAILGFSGCMSSFLRLCELSAGDALLEVGWNLPDRDLLHKRIGLFKELVARNSQTPGRSNYQTALQSLQDCEKELQASQELEIDITYCIPPAMNVK